MPFNLLVPRFKLVIAVHDPILLGTVPDRLLAPRCKNVKDVNDPMLLGIVPYRLLISRFNDCNDVNELILLGIVPTSDRLPNRTDVTLSYVADPLTAPHVTP